MNRRDTVLALVALGAMPLASFAQPGVRQLRVGILSPVWTRETNPILAGVLKGLRDLGYVEGQTFTIEYRGAEGRGEQLGNLAVELVRLKVDVIVAISAPAILAAKNATSTIPIVMAFSVDPVASGFVATLSRPGGNITGLAILASDLSRKRLEFLKDAIPTLSLVAVLANPANDASAQQVKEMGAIAQSLKLRLQIFEAREPSQFRGVFSTMQRKHAALIVLSDPMFYAERKQILELAANRRMPIVSDWKDMAEAGALIAYGPSLDHLAQRAATYVDKILRGTRPSDIPVEQPTRFDLIINLKTAKALGIKIPNSIMVQATKVIE